MSVEDQDERLLALLQPPPLTASLFAPSSRYAGLGTAVLDPDGERPVVYLLRRFVPRPERLTAIGRHVVDAGERTDHIAAARLGDPELFWRLCDANRATFAEDLVGDPGRTLWITLPETAGAP
jgi:hypothetical protein